MESTSENNMRVEAALRYREAGLSVIPFEIYAKPNEVRAGKRPYLKSWMKYQNEVASVEEIKSFFTDPKAQVAIVTGEVSNLMVIDIDLGASDDRIKFFNSFRTLKVKTPSGGQHHYYRLPKGVAIKTRAAIFGPDSHIDIRAEGGLVIVPPSVYPNGVAYEWSEEFNPDKIAELPESILRVIQGQPRAEKQSGIAEIANGVNEGSRNASAASMAGFLLQRFKPNEWDTIAYPLYKAWNEQNKPVPLPLDELNRTFESIKNLERANHSPKEHQINIGNAMSLGELLAIDYPEAQFAVERLFEAETINMLSAPPNKWKSWLALHLALCLASGNKFLGEFVTQKQGVLIVNEEDTERLLKERCKLLMSNADKLPVYFYIGKGIKLTEEFVEKVLEEAKSKNATFVIFDSLRSVHEADENSSKEMQIVMDQLKRIMREHITVLFTHHNRKKSRSKGSDDWGEESRGSSAINAAIHGHLSCEEVLKDEHLYLVITQAKLKGAEKLKAFGVKIEKDEGGMHFTHDGEYDGKNKSFEANKSVLKLFDESMVWLGVKDLTEMGYGKETTVRALLKRGVSSNQLQSMERKRVEGHGYQTRSAKGGHNEILYFRFGAEEDSKGPGPPDVLAF